VILPADLIWWRVDTVKGERLMVPARTADLARERVEQIGFAVSAVVLRDEPNTRTAALVDHPSDIRAGSRYSDSSGDYLVTSVFRFVWGATVRIAPDDFRGTAGRPDRRDFTVKPYSLVLRFFRNDS
jgi:hypothetical protein